MFILVPWTIELLREFNTQSETRCRCDVKPTVTFPATRPVGRYSFPVSSRVGGRDDLSGWLYTNAVYSLNGHPSEY